MFVNEYTTLYPCTMVNFSAFTTMKRTKKMKSTQRDVITEQTLRDCSTPVATAGLKDTLTNWLRSIVEKPFVKRPELNAGANPATPSVPGRSAGRGDREEGADAECEDQNES
jgi:hypothetical protein